MTIKRINLTLVEAACYGDAKLTRSSLRQGANPNTRFRGTPALSWAVQQGHVNVAKILIRAGASVEKKEDHGFTPLDQATGVGNLEMVKLLLRAGAKVNGRTYNGSALHTACAWRHVQIVKLLLAHGANPDSLDKEGRTPVKFTRMGKRNRKDGIIRALLAQVGGVKSKRGAKTKTSSSPD